jgi:hypothetical protein
MRLYVLCAAAESHTERTTISLRLCVFARKKRKKVFGAPRRQAAKGLPAAGRLWRIKL